MSDHALPPDCRVALIEIAKEPHPTLWLNALVVDRLFRERLIEFVDLKSPMKSHAGRLVPHAKITAEGRAKLGLPPETKAKKGRKK